MLSHADWLSKKGYIQHLEVLRRINQRKHTLTARSTQTHFGPKRKSIDPSDRSTHEVDPSTQKMNSFQRTSRIPMRQQQITWANYHLGKRIIETSPVISKRRLDMDYKQHERLVKCLTLAVNKPKIAQFRLRKLQEFKENIEVLTDDRKIMEKTQYKSHFLLLHIEGIRMYVGRDRFQNVRLSLRYQQEEQKNGSQERNSSAKTVKKYKQSSQCIPYSALTEHHFYFSMSKKHLSRNSPICLELINIKGLEAFSIGYFTFKLDGKVELRKTLRIFHCGKVIGQVGIQAELGSKAGKRVESTGGESNHGE